jgi:hypothetical protein
MTNQNNIMMRRPLIKLGHTSCQYSSGRSVSSIYGIEQETNPPNQNLSNQTKALPTQSHDAKF